MVGRPLLQQRVVAARQLAIDDGGEPPFAEFALQLFQSALAEARRRLVDHARELHRQCRAADAEDRAARRYRARHRRQRDFHDAREIDAERVERAAEVAILMEGEAAPILFRHLADRNGFVIGVRYVAAMRDRRVRVVHVAQAIEARIEGADEISLGIIDGGGEPALGVVAELLVHREVAQIAADGRCDVDQEESEEDVEKGGGEDVAQWPELRIESHAHHQPAQHRARQPENKFRESRQMPQET